MARKKRRGILFSLGSKTELVMASYSKEIWGWRHDRGRQPFAEERTNEGGEAKKVETRFVRYFQSGKLESLRIKPSSSSSSVASSPSNHPPYPREQEERKEKRGRGAPTGTGGGWCTYTRGGKGKRREKRDRSRCRLKGLIVLRDREQEEEQEEDVVSEPPSVLQIPALKEATT